MATVGPLYSEGRTPATETAFVSTQYRTFLFLSMGSFGVRREADRERRTERGHWFRGNMPLHAAPQQPLHSRHSRSTAHRQAVNSQPFPPPDGLSTRYERQDFVALACRARRTVQVRLRAPSGSRLFPPPGLRLVLTALSRTSPRRVVRHAGQAAGAVVRAAVSGCASLAHPRRIERP